MEFGWTSEQQDLHQRMRQLGARAEAEVDRWRLLASEGVLGLCIASEHGGGGHDLVSTAYAFEGLGATLDDGGLFVALGAHLFGVSCTIERAGSDEQRRRWLPALCRGDEIATIAATEAGSGSDVARVETAITRSGAGWRVRGDKRFVTNAAAATLFLVLGKGEGRGLTMALVPASEHTVVGERYAARGLLGAGLAPVRFDTGVSDDAILGRPGAGMAVFQIAMTFERALILAFRLGAMQRSLDQAVAFVRERRLGDRPLSDHQAVSQRVARMKLRLETSRLLLYRAAWELDHGGRGSLEAALAKWHLAEAAVDSALDAFRLGAGQAFVEPTGELDDALGSVIHSGTSDVLSLIVARLLGL